MIYNELKQHGRDDFPFELYRINSMHPKYEMAYHWHTNFEFVRVLSGSLTLFLDNRRSYCLGAGDVAFINSETVHGATPRDCQYECIVFNMDFLRTGNRECDAFIDGLTSQSLLLRECPQDNEVRTLAVRIFEEIGKRGEGSEFKTLGLFCQLMGEIRDKGEYIAHIPTKANDDKKSVKLKLVLKFIRDNFASDITLGDMAAVVGYSEKYFCKFFKELTGTTPINYLMSYRVERAARKLLGTDLSVTRIAYDCGFNDLSYFIKTFKALKGIPPNEYRKK